MVFSKDLPVFSFHVSINRKKKRDKKQTKRKCKWGCLSIRKGGGLAKRRRSESFVIRAQVLGI